ncbi:holin [Mycolicibacterium elephantis]|uniref:holin n=1 Tax=Mycolicibacterium elephantis TaxID=81858 RepID=UPI0007E9E087|nr:holin [Mycolicibacterium elephantis]OBB20625.1 hypothetical protein A5762_15330 [Mycolicibacterium elephantis]
MWTVKFWKDAAERAVKTAAQAAIVTLGGDVFNAWQADWATVAGVGVGGAILSVLTSLASTLRGERESASLAK